MPLVDPLEWPHMHQIDQMNPRCRRGKGHTVVLLFVRGVVVVISDTDPFLHWRRYIADNATEM